MAKEETKKTGFQITRALQQTLKSNPRIKEVYFSENGDHYFKKHEVEVHSVNDQNVSTGSKKVQSLPGVTRQPVKVKKRENGKEVLKDTMVNVAYEPVAATFTREEVLNATAVADRKTEAEKIEILRQAAEIAKEENFQALMSKISGKSKE